MIHILDVVGNSAPSYELTLQNDGTAIDLSAASTVELIISNERTGTITNASNDTCVITSASAGQIRYDRNINDFPTSGRYKGDVKITFSSGAIETLFEYVIFAIRD